ncbi:MAG TPA: type II secretion system F family protein [Candidatus Acidoferrales bacterium]|nr:type II secretion system F family protein [Candidatus Acidoferrales bacterium]
MVWQITAITFLGSLAVITALLLAFMPGEIGIGARLSRLLNSAPVAEETTFAEKQRHKARDTLAAFGQMMPGGATTGSGNELVLLRAGYRSPNAVLALRGARILVPAALAILVYATGVYRSNPFLMFGLALIIGYMLPEGWLLWRVHARQHRLRLSLPDGLDLLVICVEAGLGLDQSFIRVSEELRIAHPELSEELHLVNLEMRVGKTRLEALRELARRTGLEDIKSLVAMLIQTERFGTSVAQSLRIHSDDLRTKRRQRAEEMAAKTTVKMVPALVFFIFPALMVVILGPALIALMKQFSPVLQR